MKRTFTAAALSVSFLAGATGSLLISPDITIARTAHLTLRVTRAMLAPTLSRNPRHFARFSALGAARHVLRVAPEQSHPSGLHFALRTGAGATPGTDQGRSTSSLNYSLTIGT